MGKKDVPKTRCGGTMTEAQYLAWIRSALRSKWLRWQPRNDCLEAARRPYKGPKKQQKWEYQCAICTNWFTLKDMEVDHYPHDAGSIRSVEDIGPFVGRLYCETDNLRAVCKPCHLIHTYAQKEGITFEEARAAKKVIAFGKLSVAEQGRILKLYGVGGKNAAERKAAYNQLVLEGRIDG